MRSSHVGLADCCAILARFTFVTVLAVATMPALAAPIAYLTTGDADFGTVDTATGAFSSRGHFTATVSGLGVFNGTLYAISYHSGTGTLYIVNPANAGQTTVGTSSVIYDDFGSTLSGLYAVDTSANLYSINPANGAATLIGATGVALGTFRGLSTNSGTLYFAS